MERKQSSTKMPEGHSRCGMCGKVLPVLKTATNAYDSFALHACRHGKKGHGLSAKAIARKE